MPAVVDKTPAKIRRMFSDIAETYDLLNCLLSFGMDAVWRRRVAELCRSRGRVLDVCCGTGDLTLSVGSRGSATTFGVDFSNEMVKHAIRKSRGAENNRSFHFCVADALRLPFKNGAFDACTVAFGIRNTMDTPRCMSEMKRVTTNDGLDIILEFSTPRNPLLRRCYHLYFRSILPLIGNAVSRTRAYSYLVRSVNEYYRQSEMERMMNDLSFRDVRATPMTFGISTMYVGKA